MVLSSEIQVQFEFRGRFAHRYSIRNCAAKAQMNLKKEVESQGLSATGGNISFTAPMCCMSFTDDKDMSREEYKKNQS